MVFFVVNATPGQVRPRSWNFSRHVRGAENICSSNRIRMALGVIIHEICEFLDQKIEDHGAKESYRDKLFLRD
jgi:hypothetical protein